MFYSEKSKRQCADIGDTVITNKGEYVVIDTSLINDRFSLLDKNDLHVNRHSYQRDEFYVGNELLSNEFIKEIKQRKNKTISI